MTASRIAAFVAVATALSAGPAVAGPQGLRYDEAKASVAREIARLAIPAGRIGSVEVLSEEAGMTERDSTNYIGWVHFTDCPGALAIELGPTEAVRTIYVVGDCPLPGKG